MVQPLDLRRDPRGRQVSVQQMQQGISATKVRMTATILSLLALVGLLAHVVRDVFWKWKMADDFNRLEDCFNKLDCEFTEWWEEEGL
jgi:hypothetical protein